MKLKVSLWTRDFTIITIGTVVSMLGHSIASFAIGLLVLEYTGSTFLYTLYLAAYNLPKVLMPLIAGPWLDSFSRKKAIYGLDFAASGHYLFICFLISTDRFSYGPFLFLCLLMGSIDSAYEVAYESLYPTLVPPGLFRKAYAISSLIYPIAMMMVPVAAFAYQHVGFAPLFAFNSFCFFIAAVFETQIKAPEEHLSRRPARPSAGYLKSEFTSGMDYIKSERGLMVITAYFFCAMTLGSVSYTLWLPFFRSGGDAGVRLYSYVMGANVLGRLISGFANYKIRFRADKKFTIAIFVYVCVTILGGTFVFFGPVVMLIMCFFEGMLAATSYNIRISATQSYVPNAFRARFNGLFLMIVTLGNMLGALVAGALGEYLRLDYIIAVSQLLNLFAIYYIMYRERAHVKRIYNREV